MVGSSVDDDLLARPIPPHMRALVKQEPGPGEVLIDVPVPRPGPGEVLIRLEAVSLCGTDVHIDRWDPWAAANVVTPGSSATRWRGGSCSSGRASRASRSASGSPPRPISSTGPATSAAPAGPTSASTTASWPCTSMAPSPSTSCCPRHERLDQRRPAARDRGAPGAHGQRRLLGLRRGDRRPERGRPRVRAHRAHVDRHREACRGTARHRYRPPPRAAGAGRDDGRRHRDRRDQRASRRGGGPHPRGDRR